MPREKILVVDDEKNVTMTLKGLFTALGHEMLTALNGEEAIKIIDSQAPSLILLDIKMPGINGFEIIKKLRQEKPNIKIIIITTYASDTKAEAEKLGIDGFFPKPIDLNGLMERIRFVMESAQSTRFYPTREVKESAIAQTPEAKILFIEPNPMVFAFTCALFSVKEMIRGNYQIQVVYGAEEGFKTLYTYQPDIVIMYDSIYHMEDVKRFAGIIMNQTHKPKTVILHGLIPKMDSEIRELEKMGIKFCNQGFINDEELRVSNHKLVDFVARECIKQGLVTK